MKPVALVLALGLAASFSGNFRAALAAAPCDIRPKIVALKPDFDPVRYGDCNLKNDSCDEPPRQADANDFVPPITSAQADDIVAAFGIAPPFFQTELCSLDYIFIDTDPNSSNPLAWGLRERLHHAQASNSQQAKHIGLSAKIWELMGSSPPYGAYETQILKLLLAPNNAPQWMQQFTVHADPDPAASTNPTALAFLAILAHEMGHIEWWEKNVPVRICVRPNQPQVLPKFADYSWPNSKAAHGFHRLGRQDKSNRTKDLPDKQAVWSELLYDDPPGSHNFPDAVDDLVQLYTSGNWASLFATAAVDEDFVETFKLWVVKSAVDANKKPYINDLSINIPSRPPIDILSRFSEGTKLYEKARWIQRCLKWTPPPEPLP